LSTHLMLQVGYRRFPNFDRIIKSAGCTPSLIPCYVWLKLLTWDDATKPGLIIKHQKLGRRPNK